MQRDSVFDQPNGERFMKERRAWRVDLAAGILFVVGLLVAVAIFSHDPADIPGSQFPEPERLANVLGPLGAWIAGECVATLGLAVYPWLAAWFVLVLALVLRRNLLRWSARLLGWLLLIPSVAVLARHGPELPSSLPSGDSRLGLWLEQTLQQHYTPEGTQAVAVGVLLLGGVLAGDFLLWPSLTATAFVLRLAGSLGRRLLARRKPVVKPTELAISLEPRPVLSSIEPVAAPPDSFTAQPDNVTTTIAIQHHEAIDTAVSSTDKASDAQEEPADGSCGLYSERQRFAFFKLPPLQLLEDARPQVASEQDQALRERANLLEKTFADFGLEVKVVGINTGPVVTMYEVTLKTGLRLAKVVSLSEDIALNLKVPSVRMVAPLPGKNAVGIEIPNEIREDVRIKEVIQASLTRASRYRVPIFLGKDAEGRPLICDLTEMPHLLIAGTTGTGKSVCLTTIILSLLMTRRPDEVRMVLIDPKSGVEMQWCSRIPHLMAPIIEDMKKAEAVLAWAVDKMEERYDLLKRARVRNIAGYNELSPQEIVRRVRPIDDEEKKRIPDRMSYIVIVIDEMADLMMQFKKEVEGYIIRLAQKSRAAGIHLVLATQKPTVDVITGLIKSNLPSRICFKVAQKSDSRVVLDQMGADKLLGRGDLLFLPPGSSDLVRAQGAYASEAEILRVADFLESEPFYEPELLQLKTREMREAEESGDSLEERLRSRDKLYEQAVEIVVREGRGSVSLLQRTLGIGYGRAARLIDFMAQDGIVGAYNGSNARDVLYSPEQWAQMRTKAESSD